MISLYNVFKKVAFTLDAESAHTKALHFLHNYPEFAKFIFNCDEAMPRKFSMGVGGVKWKFPVGLAAGLDKNAEALHFFSALPFGAIEVGTVTPKAQEGNPKPRMFRYPEEESLRNCMGFNNKGANELLNALSQFSKENTPIGVNLGKNKDTPAHHAPDDYRILFNKFKDVADYLVVNVSSPNTPGLRDLQKASELRDIFSEIEKVRKGHRIPLYLKISPDINPNDLSSIVEVAKEFHLDALIATNTTIMPERGAGGVSGKLLFEKSKMMRSHCLEALREVPTIDFIGVGGFSNFDQLWSYWREGGRAIQIYTSFIYQGPELLFEFRRKIDEKMHLSGAQNMDELLEFARKSRD